jgi:hypothetical protein
MPATRPIRPIWRVPAAVLLIGMGLSLGARAEEPMTITLTIKDHRFSPSEIRVPVGRRAILHVQNDDATPEEFDSTALQVEKVIVGGAYGTVRLRPLGPGRYPFMGEFHPDTAQGVVIAE